MSGDNKPLMCEMLQQFKTVLRLSDWGIKPPLVVPKVDLQTTILPNGVLTLRQNF